jgi:cardiolipin synthase
LARLFTRLLNFRNHRKIVVVDGRIGFTGGINVTDEENDTLEPTAWRDTHIRLEGPCVALLQRVFLEDWCYLKRRPPELEGLFVESALTEGAAVQILDSGPDKGIEPIKHAYFAAIGAANERVLLTMAYFIPDDAMLFALKSAALRGVDVRILLSRKSDSYTVSAAARSYYDDLLAAGVRIFEYEPRMLHAKTLVVDDWFAAVGTSNFDTRSFRLNFEVSALVYDQRIATELGELFERDLESAKRITQSARVRLPFFSRLGENTARVLSPLL